MNSIIIYSIVSVFLVQYQVSHFRYYTGALKSFAMFYIDVVDKDIKTKAQVSI